MWWQYSPLKSAASCSILLLLSCFCYVSCHFFVILLTRTQLASDKGTLFCEQLTWLDISVAVILVGLAIVTGTVEDCGGRSELHGFVLKQVELPNSIFTVLPLEGNQMACLHLTSVQLTFIQHKSIHVQLPEGE